MRQHPARGVFDPRSNSHGMCATVHEKETERPTNIINILNCLQNSPYIGDIHSGKSRVVWPCRPTHRPTATAAYRLRKWITRREMRPWHENQWAIHRDCTLGDVRADHGFDI